MTINVAIISNGGGRREEKSRGMKRIFHFLPFSSSPPLLGHNGNTEIASFG